MMTIVIQLMLVACSLQVSAQKVKEVKNRFIESSGTHFAQPVKDKKWSNSNGNSYTKAKYAAYEGVSFIKLKATEDVDAILKFEIKVEKGELGLEVVDAENKVVFEKSFAKSETGETKMAFKKNENYQVRFIGKNTNGNYFCQWVEIPRS